MNRLVYEPDQLHGFTESLRRLGGDLGGDARHIAQLVGASRLVTLAGVELKKLRISFYPA
jgi:hypothetical protein